MNPHDEDSALARLLAAARLHQPYGEPGSCGFETRLRAALAASAPGLFDCLATFSWRFAVPGLPLASAAALFVALRHEFALPDGVGGLVTQWSGLLPLAL